MKMKMFKAQRFSFKWWSFQYFSNPYLRFAIDSSYIFLSRVSFWLPVCTSGTTIYERCIFNKKIKKYFKFLMKSTNLVSGLEIALNGEVGFEICLVETTSRVFWNRARIVIIKFVPSVLVVVGRVWDGTAVECRVPSVNFK